MHKGAVLHAHDLDGAGLCGVADEQTAVLQPAQMAVHLSLIHILARSNRSYELFFVNGRFVRDAVLSGAVEAACHERVMIGKYPYCVLNLSLIHISARHAGDDGLCRAGPGRRVHRL